jgi:hypothetical protein
MDWQDRSLPTGVRPDTGRRFYELPDEERQRYISIIKTDLMSSTASLCYAEMGVRIELSPGLPAKRIAELYRDELRSRWSRGFLRRMLPVSSLVILLLMVISYLFAASQRSTPQALNVLAGILLLLSTTALALLLLAHHLYREAESEEFSLFHDLAATLDRESLKPSTENH